MKVILPILCLCVVLGVLYGLAFIGVIPTAALAAKNPMLAKALVSLHLAHPKKVAAKSSKTKTSVAAKPDPQQQALLVQQSQLASEQAQLAKDKAAFAAQKSAPAVGATPGDATSSTPSASTGGAKLSAIYATMSPDDIAQILAKLPDAAVITTFESLDPAKAGKILAALPADRAARLSQQMMPGGSSSTRTASALTTLRPATSLP